ncbi:hypothetical protein CRG49_000570 [Neisseria sp. N95_16]|uniref:Uncharacterized protein n=1 Tax=Neisseria brasiliensis TaxID=2666100 RepID=A0A7X2KYX0_9NEIS|nr:MULTISPECIES: hypothetical protein [Neisseria]MRN38613.1 hypothetical protein [Neisseria brasiliensis]PJO10746.1 hypothetical protein CRG49_000570 [Neisseria sp. N95_16]
MTLSQLKWDLYWAYGRDTTVMSKCGDGTGKSAGVDLYEVVLASSLLKNMVAQLPSGGDKLIKGKYERGYENLKSLAELIATHFDLPEQAAQLFLLRWLELPHEQELQSLTGILQCSKSTVTKKCRKVCVWLDNLEMNALYELRSKIIDN